MNQSLFFAAESAKAQLRANFMDFIFRNTIVNFSAHLLITLRNNSCK